jgi:hypothetical protein
VVHCVIDLSFCWTRLRLPTATDLNLPIYHGTVATTLSGVVVVAASLSAASLPGTPELPGIHARRMYLPRVSLLHVVLTICRIRVLSAPVPRVFEVA